MKQLLLCSILAVMAAPTLSATPSPKDQTPATSGGPVAPNRTLREIKGVVSWKTLSHVEEVRIDDRIARKFSDDIVGLDSKPVKLQGFMLPLEPGRKQKRFLLSANVPSCPFCMPGGAESLIEVQCREPIAFDMQPIVISGRFAVLKKDPTGLWYRVTDATLVKD